MQEADNTKVVQAAYAAFGRGDVQGVLNALAQDVDWVGVVGAASQVPMRGPRHGVAAVGQFFKTVSENIRFSTFEPREFVAQGNKVVALGHYAGTATKTGKQFSSDFVMVFTLEHGKVTKFREYLDVDSVNSAFA